MPPYKNIVRITLTALLIFAVAIYLFSNFDVSEVANNLTRLEIQHVALATLLSLGVAFSSAIRFILLVRLRFPNFPILPAIQASVLGNIAGLVTIQILGQMAGRQALLQRYGVDPSFLGLITILERLILLGIGLASGLFATLILFDLAYIEIISNNQEIVTIIFAIICMTLSFSFFRNKHEVSLLHNISRPHFLFGLLASLAAGCVTWGLTLSVFVFYTGALVPNADIVPVLAVAAVVSLGAALPITVNGWGTREFLAVLLFPIIGISPIDAASISVLVGLTAMAGIVALTPVLLLRRPSAHDASAKMDTKPSEPKPKTEEQQRSEIALGALFAASIPALIFFQVIIGSGNFNLSVNLADPAAFLCFCVVAVSLISSNGNTRFFAQPYTSWLLGIWAILFLAAAVAWIRFDLTEWSFFNRLVGWFIVIGYFSAGVGLANLDRHRFGNRVAKTALLTVVLILAFEGAGRVFGFGSAALADSEAFVTGFHQIHNALSFLILCSMAFALAFYDAAENENERRLYRWGLFLAGAAAIATGSPDGIVSLGLASALALFMFPKIRTEIGVFVAVFVISGVAIGLFLLVARSGGLVSFEPVMAGDQSALGSFLVVKFETARHLNAEAVELWRQFWLLGGGLGSFLATREFGDIPVTIHNVWLWALAELGPLGLVALVIFFLTIIRDAWRHLFTNNHRYAASLTMMLTIFFVFSVFHDILFQRGFWFFLGFLLASLRLNETQDLSQKLERNTSRP